MKLQYTREFILSFADKECCKERPEGLDPGLSRDSPSPEIVEAPGLSRFAGRRDRDYETPEWRKSSGNCGGLLPHHSSRRKSAEEGPPNAPVGNPPRNQGQKWECRGRGYRAEHDGLLGSGNTLRPSSGGRGTRNGDSRLVKVYRAEDSVNGETFGEKDASSESLAEEEKKRREAFELERKRLKEQRQQGKKSEIHDVLEEIKSADSSAAKSDVVVPDTTAVSRPLVPPGFGQAKPRKELNRLGDPVALEKENPVSQPQSDGYVDPLFIACSAVAISDHEELKHTVSFQGSDDQGLKSSKFAHLFNREEDVLKPSSPTDINSNASHARMLPMPVGPSLQDIEKGFLNTASEPGLHQTTFLTCEDIEQSLMAEAQRQPAGEEWKPKPKPNLENDVSHHLLSLLQKGSKQRDDGSYPCKVEPPSPEDAASDIPKTEKEPVTTLEALFGRSFMMELRSTDAPLSAKVAAETKYIDNLSLVQKPRANTVEAISKPNGVHVLDGMYPNRAGAAQHALWTAKQRDKDVFLQGFPEEDFKAGFPGLTAEELNNGVFNDVLKMRQRVPQPRSKGNDLFLIDGLVTGDFGGHPEGTLDARQVHMNAARISQQLQQQQHFMRPPQPFSHQLEPEQHTDQLKLRMQSPYPVNGFGTHQHQQQLMEGLQQQRVHPVAYGTAAAAAAAVSPPFHGYGPGFHTGPPVSGPPISGTDRWFVKSDPFQQQQQHRHQQQFQHHLQQQQQQPQRVFGVNKLGFP